MATTKTVQTVNVSTIDENGKQTTFNLDNPKENLTKREVVETFNYGIQNNLLISNYGAKVKSVGTVTISTSTKIELEGEPIYITPAELEITSTTSITKTPFLASGKVNVSGANIQGANIKNINYITRPENQAGYIHSTRQLESEPNKMTIEVSRNADNTKVGTYQSTATLMLIVNGSSYEVPVTFNLTITE